MATMAPERVAPIPLAGEWKETSDRLEVRSPYDGSVIAVVAKASSADIDAAIGAAQRAFETTRQMPAHQRSKILAAVSAGLAAEREDFARTLSAETGKPIRDARTEVDRATMTFAIAAEETKRVESEVVPMDWAAHGENRFAINSRFPIGVVLAITPFNFPLNLTAHKIAPAIAVGNTVVVKPASQTPLSGLKLAKLVIDSGWPAAALSVVPSDAQTFEAFVTDARVRKITFTGSPVVGWHLKQIGWRKKVTLELGGNAGVILHEDADIDYALGRIVTGGFGYSGQSCISVQRLYIHRPIFDRVRDELVERVSRLVAGDPSSDTTDVGPMISESAAERVESWVGEAVAGGAKVLVGGKRDGAYFEPTVVVDATPDMKICAQEVFAPLIGLFPYDDFGEAVKAVDDSEFGLQAGVFTRDINRIWQAYRGIDVGGLIVNDIPTYRIDQMPYGGSKDSGWGREGIKYAIEEMTEPRLMVIQFK
jgi:acyl-CoA reductase-like NAD-dependent aldehyde dehydrogenase